jgi:phosphodiesterase/alkaline phosphatase D-like protein
VTSTSGSSASNAALLTVTVANSDAALVAAPNPRDVTATAATVEWTAPFFDATGYTVQRALTAEGPWDVVASGGLQGRAISDAGLAPNTTYHYRLGAVNGEGAIVWSRARSVTTSPPPPGTPFFPRLGTVWVEADWTAAPGATAYKLERAPDVSGVPGAFAQTTMATSYVFQWDYGLSANTVYWFRVRAWNGVSDSPYSDSASVMTAPNAPGVPVFSDVGPRSVTVTWTEPVLGAATYKLERASSDKGPWSQLAAGIGALEYTDATVTGNRTYWYRVRATNARGVDGAFAVVASVTTPVDPSVSVPAAPAAPTFATITSTYLNVKWTAAMGASIYTLERALDSGGAPGAWAQILTGTTALSQFDLNLTPNTKLWYRVRGTNAGGDGTWSTPSTATTLPSAPGPVTFGGLAPQSVTLTWTPPQYGAASYRVERAPAADGTWTQIAGGVSASTYTDSSVGPNASYWYRVKATSAAGLDGVPTAPASVTTPVDPAVSPPGAPGTPTFSAVSYSYQYVNWTAATGAATYAVERAPNISGVPGAWTAIGSPTTALRYLDSNLAANRGYWYRVRATNTGGDGPYSTPGLSMTAPQTPGPVTFGTVTTTTVALNWTEPAGGTASFAVDRASSAIGPWAQLASGLATLAYTDATVAANVTYWYRVRGTNALGISGASTSGASVTTPIDPAVQVPAAPGTPTYSSVSSSYQYVNWTAAAGVSTYKVERAPDVSAAPGSWAQVAGPLTSLSHLNSGLTANTAYWYRVRATNAGGDGAYSAPSQSMTAPNAPGVVGFTGVGPSTVTVTWSVPAGGAATYEVDRGGSSIGPWTQIATGLPGLGYIDATVAANVTYWYRARATNARGIDGISTSAASVTTPVDASVTVPPAPAAPTFSSVTTSYLYVNWMSVPAAVSYKVDRAPDASGALGAWTQVAGPVTSLTQLNSGLSANMGYWYRVRATNAGGDGPSSQPSLAMTVPATPGTVTFTGVGAATVTIGWVEPAGGAASYKVERATQSSGPWTDVASGVAGLRHTDDTVAPATTYWYRVRATNALNFDGSATPAASVTTPAALGAAPTRPSRWDGAFAVIQQRWAQLGASRRVVLTSAWRGRPDW